MPVCHLFSTVFPPITLGWLTGAQQYGLPDGEPRWASVNGWMYYAPSAAAPSTYPALDAAATATWRDEPWRADVRRWHDVDRPTTVAANRALQAEAPATMEDDALVDHLRRAVRHFAGVGPMHFELHTTFTVIGGLAMQACRGWGIDQVTLAPLLAGSSPGSSGALSHIDRIAAACRAAGLFDPTSEHEIRSAGIEAGAALDAYLDEYGWRCLDQHELRGATLAERPEVLVASVRGRLASVTRTAAVVPRDTEVRAVRDRVPPEERSRFDSLLQDLRAAYGLNDDNVGVTFGWPLGLVRRAALEVGRRSLERGLVHDVEHVFETDVDELLALLAGHGPSPDELAERSARRERAGTADPPVTLGEPVPAGETPLPASVAALVAARNELWGSGRPAPQAPLSGLGIGDSVYRGRACVIDGDGYLELEPGDVIVATVTHAGHNTVLPIAGALATEHGGLLSHPAVLARELGLPAVVGVAGLLARVHTGQTIEVDPLAGVVRILE